MTLNKPGIAPRAATELEEKLETNSLRNSNYLATGEHRSLYAAVTSKCCAQPHTIALRPISQSLHFVAT